MRVRSAGAVKQLPQSSALQSAPKAGTRLRAVYDLLQSNRGRDIAVSLGGMACALEDYYGLDLRRNHGGTVTLVGEYVGEFYHDYVNDRIVHQRDL